jgi:Xaa-Pro dipeptidase
MGTVTFDFAARWQRAADAMAGQGIDALFLMKPANLAYFTGDGRPCALALLTRAQRCIVAVPQCDVPSVQRASAATEIRAFRSEDEMFHGFRDVLREQGLAEATIAIEKNFFDAALYEVFTAHILPKAKVVPAAPLVSALRMIKDASEIECLKSAARVADAGMAAAARAIRVGVRETDVAGEAEHTMRSAGAEGWASATYVASGWRSAMAHGPASLKSIDAGDVVQVHLAPVASGYTVDLCRTFIVPPVADAAASALRAYKCSGVRLSCDAIAALVAGSVNSAAPPALPARRSR